MKKTELRRIIRDRKQRLTEEQIITASARLCERFLKTDSYRQCETLFGYCSFNQEVRTEAILRQALQDGKHLALPKIIEKELRFVLVDDLNLLTPGLYGIPEPIQSVPVSTDERALVLMPGLAFDPSGHRIGYGGGYYDRYLSLHREHTLVALCYDFQLVEHLETEEYDVPVHIILSERVQENADPMR